MSISAVFLRHMARSVGRLGVEADEFLRAIGLEDEGSPDAFVSERRVEQVLAQLGRRLGEPIFGLRIACASPLGSLGTFDYLFASSRTLRDALIRMSRLYEFLVRGVSWHLEEGAGVARMALRGPPGSRYATALLDLTFGIVMVRVREGVGDVHPIAVRFRHPETDGPALESFFGVRPSFGQDVDEICFDAALLDRPLRTADARTVALLEASTLETIAKLRTVDAFMDGVRAAVTRCLASDRLELPQVARELGQSERTLQRLLQERGTSHREVVDGVRRELAVQRLADRETSMAVVAHELGFATPRAFCRAFSRWTGMTPTAFRAARAAAKTQS